MKTIKRFLFAASIAIVASGCTSAYFSQVSTYDDLYATHDVKAIAEGMKNGIDPRKWICVEADDLKVAGFGDVVMLIMVNSDSGMTAQSFVDAFAKVAGFEAEFVICP